MYQNLDRTKEKVELKAIVLKIIEKEIKIVRKFDAQQNTDIFFFNGWKVKYLRHL